MEQMREEKTAHIEAARPFTMNDLEAVVALRLHAITTEPQAFSQRAPEEREWSMEKWSEHYSPATGEHPSNFLEVVMSGKQAVGVLGAVPDEGDSVWKLVGMYVLPEFRGKGVASSLFEALETNIRNADGRKLTLHVNAGQLAAIKLYEKQGMIYARTDRRQRSDGTEYDRHTYEKPLVQP